MTEQSLDNVDVEPLKHLKDVWIEHDEKDVREYEVTFVCFLSLSSLCEVRKDANILFENGCRLSPPRIPISKKPKSRNE